MNVISLLYMSTKHTLIRLSAKNNGVLVPNVRRLASITADRESQLLGFSEVIQELSLFYQASFCMYFLKIYLLNKAHAKNVILSQSRSLKSLSCTITVSK